MPNPYVDHIDSDNSVIDIQDKELREQVDLIEDAIDGLGTAAAKDSTNAVTSDSSDLVESGAVYTALSSKANQSDLTASDNVPFKFGKDANGKYGYILNQGGADTVIPFKSCDVTIDGTTQSGDFDLISSYSFDPTLLFEVKIWRDFYDGVAVVLNNEINILGGTNNATYHDKWNGSSWVTISTLPYNFYSGSSAVVYNNEIHILGGSVASYRTNHYKWDGNTWTSVSRLPYYFYYGCVVVLNNEIHILGGNGNKKGHYKWNGSTWTEVSTLPYDFYFGSAVVLNNEIHILGGYGDKTAHYKWNGSNWTLVSTLPYDFNQSSAVVLNNEIHILGSDQSSYRKVHYKWNGSTWTEVSTLPYNFYQGSAVTLNNEIHILGGNGNKTVHYKWNGSNWSPNTAIKNISLQDISNLISSTTGSTVHCYID